MIVSKSRSRSLKFKILFLSSLIPLASRPVLTRRLSKFHQHPFKLYFFPFLPISLFFFSLPRCA
ncbi:hypothetical protein CPB83DRAFT_479720 [Crepidotus variabilis]|uniref:Uncharacterized protein n=1 Tax=Crepidotus variabilis TaxID=179855 RepID=A0A9P6EPD9_9AGAR|nr:hypothetical protein CPB83DRAFT_479720 [Crepidotus variabilis]